ncbi:hypothetical protein ABPG74_002278 [Tetrahymena malaccensis]
MDYYSLYQSTIFDSSSYDKVDICTKHQDTITGIIQIYKFIVTSSYDKSIKFWDIQKQVCHKKISRAHNKKIECLLKLNNSSFMSYQQDFLFFWSCRQMKLVKKICIVDLEYNPQYEICTKFNQYILINTVHQDQVFCVDTLNGTSQNEQFENFPNRISSFISLDENFFAVGYNKIIIYEFNTKLAKQNIEYTKKGYDELSLIKLNKELIVAGSMHGYIFIANWKQGTILSNLYNNGPLVKQLLLIKNKEQKQQYILSINRDRSLQIWDLKSKKQIQTYFMDRQPHIFHIYNNSKILSADKIREEVQIRQLKFSV